ncbi:uncharacterized protein LOC125573711 [Nematostella vectensis]|uniref:uncharacterized protein LOC125573711 n=1 Tax=Nematostella vectensis TaxID=45351 RepID=UPI0020773D5E|nr:uncharacterized protein LOC125573711 [Nematostella vectensis]
MIRSEPPRDKENGPGINLRKLYHLGCWKDHDAPNRALPDLFHNHRSQIVWSKWPDMTYVIQACAQHAKDKGYTVFGVQFYGECWGDKVDPYWNYKKYGPAKNCVNGVGEHWSNNVYSFKLRRLAT